MSTYECGVNIWMSLLRFCCCFAKYLVWVGVGVGAVDIVFTFGKWICYIAC